MQFDISKPLPENESYDFIIHAAGNANPVLYAKRASETMCVSYTAQSMKIVICGICRCNPADTSTDF